MPLQSNGLISIDNIRVELERAPGEISLNDANVRSLLNVLGGETTISLNNAYGKIYFGSITFNGLFGPTTSYTSGGYNYRLIASSNRTLNIVGTKSMEFLLVGGGGGGGFGGGGGGGGGGIKYIPSALWSSTKSSGVNYYSPLFYLRASSVYFDTLNYAIAGGNGANDLGTRNGVELTDAQYEAAIYSGIGHTEPGAPARISTTTTDNGNIAYAAGGGAGGTYYAGGNGGTSTNYFRKGQSGSNRQYGFESRTYGTIYGNYGQVNRNSVFSLSSDMVASPLAGLGTASCGGGGFGSLATFTGGGGTTSGAPGTGTAGTNTWGGGGGGGLGGSALAGGNRNYMGGHGGAPIILDSGWVNSYGRRIHVCGGGAGGGKPTISASGASTGGAGGYTYSDDGNIQHNSYAFNEHPETIARLRDGFGLYYPSRGGPNRIAGDTTKYYYGDPGDFSTYGFGGCGGAAGTTLDPGDGSTTYRAGGYGSPPLIIAKYL
jgi:hypothetical protein